MKVSIITAVYNNREFIGDCIESVISQSYRDIEYIIIDGGSTDGTIEVIQRYKERISKFVSEPDEGIYDAMNKGIRMAEGEIIGILNSDDFYVSDTIIEKVVKTFKEKNCDCLWGDIVYVKRYDPEKIVRYWKSSEYKEGKFQRGWHPPHPAFFAKKEIYQRHGLFNLDLKISADYQLMLRFLEKYKISSHYIPEVFVKMREGGNSNWRDIRKVWRGNLEAYRSFKINGLRVSPLIVFLKPLSKINQLFSRYQPRER